MSELLDIWITVRCDGCHTLLLEERANPNTVPERWGTWLFDHVIAQHRGECAAAVARSS